MENGLWNVFADGRMETTWRVRHGVLWHDGAALTADDLVFTARIEQDRDLPISPQTARFANYVDTVEASDARSVKVQWKRPFIDADKMFESPLPRHHLERAYTEDKTQLGELAYWNEEYVGTGPFKLRRFVRDSHVVLGANDQYLLGRPKIDEIVVRFISDANTTGANILAGEVELTLGSGNSFNEAIQVRDRWRDGKMEIAFEAWYAIYAQSIDPDPAVVAEPQFRRAVLHSLDRQEMTNSLQWGLVSVAHSYVNPAAAEYKHIERSIIRYDYDPRRAIQLIEELGHAKGADGFFRTSANQRLSVGIRARVDRDADANANLAVGDYLRRVGVDADPELYPPQVGRDAQYRATFPAFMLQRQPNGLDALIRFHSSQAPLPENKWAGENKGRYMNAEMNALIERFYMTIPLQERMQVLGQMIHHMTDRLHVMGLFYDGVPVMISNRLQHISAANQGWNAHEWEVTGI